MSALPLRLGGAGIAALALALVVILAVQNRGLRDSLVELELRNSNPQLGQFVPGFSSETLDGDPLQVVAHESGERQVLFIFTTTCTYCIASIPTVNALALRLAEDGTELIGLSLDSLPLTRAYREQHALVYPIIHFPNTALRRMYRAGRVPSTLVIDAEGRIHFARLGMLTTAASDSVIAAVKHRPPVPASVTMGSE
jgi:peroxiredoxin